MLALTHHFLIQAAHHLTGGTGWFSRYQVLGDDVVILDIRVAKAYLHLMQELGVDISFAKSLSSPIGVFEFAKRFVSPVLGPLGGIPLKMLGASRYDLSVL